MTTKEIESRKSLRRYFKHRDIKRVAEQAGVTPATAHNWLSGKCESSPVGEYLIALADKRKEELEQKISTL